jgi:hypothetical protein
MSAGTAVADELIAAGLRDEQRDEVCQRSPARNAEQDAEPEESGVTFTRSLYIRLHEVTILSLIAGVQTAWIAALGYGIFRLVR